MWGSSSAGRASRSQRGGRGFESHLLHHKPFVSYHSLRSGTILRTQVYGTAIKKENNGRMVYALNLNGRAVNGLGRDNKLVVSYAKLVIKARART